MISRCFILPLAAVAMFIVSCNKSSDQQEGKEGFEPHPTWTQEDSTAFWNKQQNGGFHLDTAWDGDTIFVNF